MEKNEEKPPEQDVQPKPATTEERASKVVEELGTLTKAKENVSDVVDKLKKSDIVSEEMKELIDQILADNSISFGQSLTNVKNFVTRNAKGTKISKEICDQMLIELKQLETKLEGDVAKKGDQSIAQMATQQVKLLKQTWAVIKESCEMTEEISKKIPKINEQVEKMEIKSVAINKLIDAYNNGEYDDEKKKIILKRINDDYQLLRPDYIRTRNEIDSLKLTIDGQVVKLGFVDGQHTDSMLQSAVLAAVSLIRGFTGKGSAVAASKNITAATNQFTKSLDAKSKIARARSDLTELKEQINQLEIRLTAVKEIKEKAEQFLRDNGIDVVDI